MNQLLDHIIVFLGGKFAVIPDKLYLSSLFYLMFDKRINWKKPVSFNEKIQWLKVNDRNPIYTKLVDKYEAKEYVASVIGKEYIVPTYAIWDDVSSIDFDSLPNSFVLKCTHNSAIGLCVCRDKKNLNIETTIANLRIGLEKNHYIKGREWPYKNVKPRIIAEKYLQDVDGSGLTDYKFYCFNGEPKYLYVSMDLDKHDEGRISFLNIDWTFAPFGRTDYKPLKELPKKPSKFDEMLIIVRKLSKGHKFLRVDLYQVGEKVFFSELTFHPCGGFMPFTPQEYDTILGKELEL